MKKILMYFSTMTLALCFSLATFAATETKGQLNFAVEGMTCGGCENSIESKVSKVPGVASAKADHKAKSLVVEAAPGATVDPEAVKKAVQDAGYKVK
jgi:copper chaperone CopZ